MEHLLFSFFHQYFVSLAWRQVINHMATFNREVLNNCTDDYMLFLTLPAIQLSLLCNGHAFIWFSHTMTILALQQMVSFLLEMLFSLYHASSNFGRTYLSWRFGWINYVTKSKPPQPVSFPYHCKGTWAVSSAHVTERKWNHINSKRHFIWYSTIQNIKTIIWHMHNINAISYRWTWCASVMVYSSLDILKVSLQEAPTELRPQMDCYMLHYVLTSTNVSQMQLTTLGRIPSPL